MCYSAMVIQDASKLGLRFKARVQTELYESLFRRRLNGEKILINKALELGFTQKPDSSMAQLIFQWRTLQIEKFKKELQQQEQRLAKAQAAAKLATELTTKLANELRISQSKIERLRLEIIKSQSNEIQSETEERIFPFHFLSMLCLDENGEKVIRPARYLMRPHSETENFDKKFGGCYNARLDRLDEVRWWQDCLGRRHGILVIQKFYENVQTSDYLKAFSLPESERGRENLVLCFTPRNTEMMFVPTLWDYWKGPTGEGFYSTALLTDEPSPEIAETGHNRTPIFLREDAIDDWLRAKGQSTAELSAVLSRRERPYYAHTLALAA